MKFNSCNLGDDEAVGIAEEFQQDNNLLKLSLRGNHISDVGFHGICEEIIKDKKCKITELDLSQNFISDGSGESLG